MLLTTQYMEEADRTTDTILVIDEGRPVASGTPAEPKERVGGAHLELGLPDAAQRRAAWALLDGWPGGTPQLDDAEGLRRLAGGSPQQRAPGRSGSGRRPPRTAVSVPLLPRP